MSEERSHMKSVVVVIGAGSIGQAIARRVSAGKHALRWLASHLPPWRDESALSTSFARHDSRA